MNKILPSELDIISFFDYMYAKYKRYWYPNLDEGQRYSIILDHSQNWKVLLRHLSKNTPGLALDLGAGEGTDAIKLALLGYEVDALEGSALGAEKIAKFSRKAGVHINVIHMDVNSFNPTRLYDVVICNGLLHYIDDKQSILQKILQATSKDGYCLTSLFSDFTPVPECHKLINVYPENEIGIVQSFFRQWEMLFFQHQNNRWDLSHPGFPNHQHSFIKIVAKKME